ncbi:MAG TPA: glycosyltransferase family 4 protein [Methylomirabilota bacterium]|nr:glycosyltransferase family 4 protein [Methylomirabilota bacterium]
MKIAVICRPYSFHGGIETSTAGFMRELVGHGHSVELITTVGQPEVPGVRVRRVPVLRHPSVLRVLSFALAARRAVQDGGYAIVQSHERVFRQDIYRAGEGCHRAYLATMGRRWARANPHHRLILSLEKKIFSLETARHIVAISNHGKAEIEGLYATPAARVSVVYNGVDLQRFHPDHRERLFTPVRRELGIGEDLWLVLFVGSGFERKGLGPLIEAVGRLGDRGCRLVVAGKGDRRPYRALAERLGLAERIHWAGAVQAIERLYAAADVVALPARYEPFGNVHLEALASGLPVLTSAAAGGAEVIRNGENGWIVSEPQPEAIAKGLEELRAADAGGLRVRARASAEPFTFGAQADRYAALYRRLGA